MSQLSEQFKSYYWKTTEDCLVELHGLSRTAAIAALDGYRSGLAADAEELGAEWMEDLHFHQEPFNLACDLAGHNLPWDEHHMAYLRIMDRNERLAGLPVYHPSAETIAAASRRDIPQPVNS
jgi:hypothetical protein